VHLLRRTRRRLKRGVDGARADGVDTDAVRRLLASERLCEAEDTSLAGAVVDHGEGALDGDDGGRVDDRRAALHVPDGVLCREDERDEVRRERVDDVGLLDVGDPLLLDLLGVVVDEHVDPGRVNWLETVKSKNRTSLIFSPSIFLDVSLDSSLAVGLDAEVSRDADALAPGSLDECLRVRGVLDFLGKVDDGHVCALARIENGNGPADCVAKNRESVNKDMEVGR
jgi:hypothetical protein